MAKPLSAKDIADLYAALPDAEKREFLQIIAASHPRAILPTIALLAQDLPDTDKVALSRFLHEGYAAAAWDRLRSDAILWVREHPEGVDEDLAAHLDAEAAAALDAAAERAKPVFLAEFKAVRDRKPDAAPDPEKVRRYAQVCELRLKNPGEWSWQKLANRFKMTIANVRKVFKESDRWLELARKLCTE